MNVLNRLARALQPLELFAARHPRLLMGSLLTLLGGFGVTAFGIAPLVPDAAPRSTQLVQPLADPQLEAQLSQLAEHRLGLLRHEHTRAGDSADSLLARLGAASRRGTVSAALPRLEQPGVEVGAVARSLGLSRRRFIEVFTEDARGVRTSVASHSVVKSAEGDPIATAAVPADATRVYVLFEGADAAGEPLVAVGSLVE